MASFIGAMGVSFQGRNPKEASRPYRPHGLNNYHRAGTEEVRHSSHLALWGCHHNDVGIWCRPRNHRANGWRLEKRPPCPRVGELGGDAPRLSEQSGDPVSTGARGASLLPVTMWHRTAIHINLVNLVKGKSTPCDHVYRTREDFPVPNFFQTLLMVLGHLN